MSVPARLAAFAVVLALVLGGAALAGAAIGPEVDDEPAAHGGHAAEPAHGGGHAAAGASASGLAVSEDGYTLEVERTHLAAGERTPLRFRITGPDGATLRDGYELGHERELHLVVVRRDTATFQHVHPRRDAAGTWGIDLALPDPGAYRLFADFRVGGEQRTLATDLFVPGRTSPNELPAPTTVDRDGPLTVDLAAPGLRAGREGEVRFTVSGGGDLQPYLGAKGHLVALREGDLAYLHVHPVEGAGAGGPREVRFAATFPTAGRYRLFLQVRAGGALRTVAYTLEVPR